LEVTKEIIRESFGNDFDQIFDSFEEPPVASGSIAQVYKAKLKTGQPVAVKVRHPWVVDQIKQDMMILYWFAQQISKLPSLEWMDLPVSIKDFAIHLSAQVDLSQEGRNLIRFNENFKDIPRVSFPKPIEGYVHEAVLVETFEEGVPITEYTRKDHPMNRVLAKMGLTTFLKMLLVDNFLHADCHSGNILVRFDTENKPEIILIDVGLVTELTSIDQKSVRGLFKSIYFRNDKEAADLMLSLSQTAAKYTDVPQFRSDVHKLFVDEFSRPLEELEIAPIITKMFVVIHKHHIKLECNLAMLAVSVAVLEGLARRLDPSLNMLITSVPYLFGDSSFGRAMRSIADAASTITSRF